MDKYEYKLCVEEILDLISKKQYKEAVEIADTVDWKNEKNVRMLCKISDLYKICKRYEDSRDVLLLAYHRNPSGRMIIYSLCELSIKLKDLENAYEFYREYTLVAPRDFGRLVLKYKIFTARGVDLEHRISTLEELKQIDYKDKWMYELAYLYHQAGHDEKCIEQCDEIIVFFGEGKYVIKALELKAAHTSLTPNQEALYKRLTAPVEPEPDITVSVVEEGAYSDRTAQQEIASGMKQILDEETAQTTVIVTEQVPVDDQATTIFSPAEVERALQDDSTGDTRVIDTDLVRQEMEKAAAKKQEEEALAKADTSEIRVPRQAMDMQPIFVPDDIPAETPADIPAATPADVPTEPVADTTVEKPEEQAATPAAEQRPTVPPRYLSSEGDPAIGNPAVRRVVEPEGSERSRGSALGMHELVIGEQNSPVIRYPSYDDMVSVQGDGQIAFVLPEEEKPDKQITGQISISDIMLEWERVKQEGEKQWTSEVARRVQEQTEGMFRSFEESARNGLLEQIESGVYHEVGEPVATVTAPDSTGEPEAIMLVDDTTAQTDTIPSGEPTAVPDTEPVTDTSSEPTAEELSFDRTPFLGKAIETEPEITSNNPEPPADDNTGILPTVDMDYLLRFAAAGEEYDRQGAQDEDAGDKAGADNAAATADDNATVENTISATEIENATLPTEGEADTVSATDKDTNPVEDTAVASDTGSADIAKDDDTSEPSEDTVSDTSDSSSSSDAANTSDDTEPEEEPHEADAVVKQETGLSPEQEERFESFIQTKNGLEQIKNALEKVSVEPGSGNLIITSEDRDSGIELGKAIIMELSDRGLITGKVAKIKAETLNKSKDPATTLASLKNGALLVLDAGELSCEALKEIQKAESENGENLFIVLIIRRRNKNKFMSTCEASLTSFDTIIDIEGLSESALVKLATEYAFSREFAIDDMGLLELHHRISDMQTESHRVLLTEVKIIVDEAITHALRMTPTNFFRVLSGKRYNENDMIVLTQRDFEE